VTLALFSSGCGAAASEGRPANVGSIRLPPGFTIETYAAPVPGARSMALSPGGVLYVGSRKGGAVHAVVNGRVTRLLSGLDTPNGIAFRDGALYVAEIGRVLRYDGIERRLADPPPPVVVTDALPKERHHGWRYMRFGPDGWLWIGIGAPCNVCDEGDPFASLARLSPDGKRFEVWARGVRNTVGFDWHPASGAVWFTDNGRDLMGDDVPPDELNVAPKAGMHFGFPHCHGGDVADPGFGEGRPCSSFTPPAANLGPHVAALGMRFYRGSQFPAEYRGDVFIAEHGSWNRSQPIGYRIMVVDVEGERARNYRVFAEGWLEGGEVSGRPVDLLEMPDGSLLVSDDHAGAVYRISYRGGG
jgi:glucose/arabinose dehydrogenase